MNYVPFGLIRATWAGFTFLPHQEKRVSLDDMPPTIAAAKAASARKSAKTSIDGEKHGMFAPGPRCRQFPYMSKSKYFAWIVL